MTIRRIGFIGLGCAAFYLALCMAIEALPQTPCHGKTAREQCACLGQVYDAKFKGCVITPKTLTGSPIVLPALLMPEPCAPPNWWTPDGRCHMRLTVNGHCSVRVTAGKTTVECSWKPKAE